MARVPGAEVLEAFYVATLTDYTAPTTTQLNTNTDLTGFMTDGGLSTPLDGSVIDAADMSSKFNKTAPGTYGGQPLEMELYRDDATDTAWTALARGTTGFIVVARFGLATPGTFAIADVVDVWPITVISRNPVDVVRNEMQRFRVTCAVTDVPAEDYSIAA